MVKFELLLSSSTLHCLAFDDRSASLLKASPDSHISTLLADEQELLDLKHQIKNLLVDSQTNPAAFCTFPLVFRAPGAVVESPLVDRSPIDGVFRSPIRAIHTCADQDISCMVYLQKDSEDALLLSAFEISRKYREQMLRQEFGSWLLEDHIEQAVIATDPMGKIVFWNRFASEIYQYERNEAMGQSIMNVTPSDVTQEKAVDIFSKLARGDHWRGFFGVQRKDKSSFMAHVTDTPVLDPEGQLKFIVGVSADYTQMHDLMETLKNLNADLELEVQSRTKDLLDRENTLRMVGAAMKESDTGIMIADERFRTIWSNGAAQELLQMSEIEIHHMLPWDFPLEYADIDEQTEPGANQIQEFYKSDNPAPMEATPKWFDTDGERQLCLSISVQAMKDSSHHIIALRDMTAERQADEAHRRAEKEAAASKTKTEMIQMLSHELRTPLQGIMGVASTILTDMDEQNSIYECLSTISASSQLLLTLINNILDLGKMDADKMQAVELWPCSLRSSVQDAVRFCEPFARINECKLTIDDSIQEAMSGRTCQVWSNQLRLEQVLINLISNAVKYSGAGREVQVSFRLRSEREAIAEALEAAASDLKLLPSENTEPIAAKDSPVAIVTVRDQGRGIPEDEFGSLFDEFGQLSISNHSDNTCRKRKAHAIGQSSGSGLGLNLVLKLMKLMKGHVWVTNCPAGGAEFHFCLPKADDDSTLTPRQVDLVTPQHSIVPHSKLNMDIGDSLRVLLLDDALINLKVVKKMFDRLGVHHIQVFTDGPAALAELRSKRADLLPNLILSDLEMPAMSGFDFLRQIRESSIYHGKGPEVIACSADWTSETEQRCLNAGFDGFLRKPLILSALRDFLVSHIQREDAISDLTEVRAFVDDCKNSTEGIVQHSNGKPLSFPPVLDIISSS